MANIIISKIESKSQQDDVNCLLIKVVANIIISKIESKSQHYSSAVPCVLGCGKYHYFKDRKQITTNWGIQFLTVPLWQISLFQRSKANHNTVAVDCMSKAVVANIIISKIESKSQLNEPINALTSGVGNIIISKIESKSQPLRLGLRFPSRCGKYHYFKDRKQITTT